MSANDNSMFHSRRKFIQFGVGIIGAGWLGVGLQNQFFPAASLVAQASPVEFPLSDLPVGGVKAITYGQAKVIVLRTPESVRALSLTCTHLGCTINWQDSKKEFHCPCHDGRFDQFGEPVAGPPTIPLESYPVKVAGDKVIVGEV